MSTLTSTFGLFLQAFSKLVSCIDATPLSETALITANTCFVTREWGGDIQITKYPEPSLPFVVLR